MLNIGEFHGMVWYGMIFMINYIPVYYFKKKKNKEYISNIHAGLEINLH